MKEEISLIQKDEKVPYEQEIKQTSQNSTQSAYQRKINLYPLEIKVQPRSH